MWVFELTTIFFVLIFIVSQTGWLYDKRHVILLLLVSVAAWLAEESSIRLYHFYLYHPQWRLFIGHIPVVVLAVWPAVVYSAWDLASQLLGNRRKWIPLAASAIVLSDAALIEVVAVRSGLWVWTEPGIFQVPVIGILGWAYFAFFCVLLLQLAERGDAKKVFFLMPLLPVLATHILLLITWWGVLRWLSGPINPLIGVTAALSLSLILVVMIFKKRAGRHVKRKTLLWRLPAALFFFILLAIHARNNAGLILFALAFAPPYLSLLIDSQGKKALSGSSLAGTGEK